MAVNKDMDVGDLAKRIEKSVNVHLAKVQKEHEPVSKDGSEEERMSIQPNPSPKIGSIL